MFLSPPEIQHQKLKGRLGNYDRAEVDELLEHVAASYDQVWHERDAALAKVAELERRIVDYEDLERLLRDSVLTGQRAAEEVKAEAERLAETLLEDARRKAEGIVARAQRDRDGVKAEIGRLRSVEQDVQARCRTMLMAALDAIGKQDVPIASEPKSRVHEAAALER